MALYAKKSGLQILKILLNHCEVLGIKRKSDGGEEQYSET